MQYICLHELIYHLQTGRYSAGDDTDSSGGGGAEKLKFDAEDLENARMDTRIPVEVSFFLPGHFLFAFRHLMKHSRTQPHRVVLLSPQTKLQKFLSCALQVCSALKYITTDITSSNLIRLMPFSYRFLQFRLCSNKNQINNLYFV